AQVHRDREEDPPMTVLAKKVDSRPRRRIPTGAPRLVESSRQRRDREHAESWEALLDSVRRASDARLILLDGCDSKKEIACPWRQLTGCVSDCRCGGAKIVTAGFLRRHYKALPDAI